MIPSMNGARNDPNAAFEKAKEPVYAGFARVPVAATAAVMAPETPAVSRCSSA